jgi:hypothetical protein
MELPWLRQILSPNDDLAAAELPVQGIEPGSSSTSSQQPARTVEREVAQLPVRDSPMGPGLDEGRGQHDGIPDAPKSADPTPPPSFERSNLFRVYLNLRIPIDIRQQFLASSMNPVNPAHEVIVLSSDAVCHGKRFLCWLPNFCVYT